MTDNHLEATTYDCGDGVPALPLLDTESVDLPHGPEPATTTGPATADPMAVDAPIGPGTVVMIIIVFGQLFLLLAVLAGGNALVGAVAGLALLVCGVTLLGARNLRRTLFGQ